MLKSNQVSSNSDFIIIEADGKVDNLGNGYGFAIKKRLDELNYTSTIVPLEEMANNNDFSVLTKEKIPWIISGGMTEVTSNKSWIVRSRIFFNNIIRNNLENKSKQVIFGICFGAQIVAESFKENSVKYLDYPNFGINELTLDLDHELFKGISSNFNAFSFHYNQIPVHNVFKKIIIHTRYNNKYLEAFEIPDSAVYGVQFHPEMNKTNFLNLIRNYRDLIEKLGFSIETLERNLIEPSSQRLKIFKNLMSIHEKNL